MTLSKILLIFSPAFVSFPLYLAAADSHGLMGNWQCRGPHGEVSLVFETAERLVFGGEPSRYKLVKGAVRIWEDGAPLDYPYRLEENSLSFISPENERYQCGRAKRAASGPSGGASGDASLAGYFAGSYYHYSGSTERRMVFCPDGTFHGGRESGYSGSFREGGSRTGAWGTAGQSAYGGKWTIRGDRTQGRISLVHQGGKREEIPYRTARERGCIHLGETLFCYEGKGDCR
ncbi:MAG: hypothetical protein IH611_12570 [Deltaproteobacteria bacterium]|nr:hypothetical protein [Deltaproteobacteria bacterium]